MLKYSRTGDEIFTAVDLKELIRSSFEMAQFKIKPNEFEFIQSIDGNLPKIKGNFTQLQEVFFNIIDNAYDAIMQRKSDLKEPDYKARLEISASESGNTMEIMIKDNGIGVKEEDQKKLFTPFFSTKVSSKKGTGLGLYVIQQIIKENHAGKVEFSSIYKSGSQTRLVLPLHLESVSAGS